jgi:hypothetical protein
MVMSVDPSVRTNVDREFKKGVPPQVQERIDWLGPELDQLAACVQDLVIWGGSVVIMSFYRQRYVSIANTVLKLGTTCKTGFLVGSEGFCRTSLTCINPDLI